MIPSLHVSFSQTYTKEGNKVTIVNPKWQLVSTHTASTSFATNKYLAGSPPLTIMAITGHKTKKAFLRYIGISPSDYAKILAMEWKKRKEIKDFESSLTNSSCLRNNNVLKLLIVKSSIPKWQCCLYFFRCYRFKYNKKAAFV